jgi:hypothetical protein
MTTSSWPSSHPEYLHPIALANVTISGNTITGGSTLPPVTMSYNTDKFSRHTQEYSAASFHTATMIADASGNGKDDLMFLPFSQTDPTGSYTLPKALYAVTPTETLAPLNVQVPSLSSNSTSSGGTDVSSLGVVKDYAHGAKAYALTLTVAYNSSGVPSSGILSSYDMAVSGTTPVNSVTATASGGCDFGVKQGGKVLIGRFDGNLTPEVLFNGHLYKFNAGIFTEDTARRGALTNYCTDSNQKAAAAADIDGDGIDEVIAGAYIYKVQNGVFVRTALKVAPLNVQPYGGSGHSLQDEVCVFRGHPATDSGASGHPVM